jgi:hypothetical protein
VVAAGPAPNFQITNSQKITPVIFFLIDLSRIFCAENEFAWCPGGLKDRLVPPAQWNSFVCIFFSLEKSLNFIKIV